MSAGEDSGEYTPTVGETFSTLMIAIAVIAFLSTR